jgi:hypothetical protein
MSLLSRRCAAPLLALAIALTAATPTAAITWDPVLPITVSGEAAAFAGSTVAFSGGIAVAYRERVGSRYSVHLKRSTDGGITWHPHSRLSSGGSPFATGPSLASSGSSLHLVFVEYRSNGTSQVIYRRSTNGGQNWTAPVAMSSRATRAGLPSITRSGSRVVLAWTDEITGAVSVRVSTDGGVTFGTRNGIASTTNQPWLDQDDDSFDAFPTIAISGGVINVAYYTSLGGLRLRRSGSNGNSWTTAVTLAKNGNGYKPILVASGSTVVAGYAIYTGTDIYTAFRRSTNSGSSWSAAAALARIVAPPSYQPVISMVSGTWRVAFEQCLDPGCAASNVYYRESADAVSWSAASQATDGPNEYQSPVGVTFTDATVLTFMTLNVANGAIDILSRRGS